MPADQTSTAADRRLEEMEAKAVDKAKASADAAFRPAPSVFNAPSADILLQQVDGPSLQTYQGTESVYVGRSVPVAAGGKLNIPIHVSTPGSVVAYAVELKAHDIYFSIMAEREEGVTVVKVCVWFSICGVILILFFGGWESFSPNGASLYHLTLPLVSSLFSFHRKTPASTPPATCPLRKNSSSAPSPACCNSTSPTTTPGSVKRS
jgi:hypothetical protein